MTDRAKAGRPAEGMAAIGRARRFAAEAYVQWLARDDDRAGTPGTGSLGCAAYPMVVAQSPDCRRVVRVSHVGAAADGERVARYILGRWPSIVASQGAVSFRLAEGDRVWSGLLLPGRDGPADVIDVVALAWTVAEADKALDRIDPPHPASSNMSPISPWSLPASGAATLLDRAAPTPLSASMRLQAVRTWAALAAGMRGAARARAVRATVAAAYDLLSGLADDPEALGAAMADLYRADPARAVARLACAEALADEEPAFASALAEVLARRQEPSSFETLLAGGGPSADVRSRPARIAAGRELRLAPVDHAGLLRRARKPAWRSVPDRQARAA